MVLAIGGCSNSGKSGTAEKIKNFFSEKKVAILCQDDFVKTRNRLSEFKGHIDWEIPSTLRIEDYISAVKKAEGQNDLVICEGLFAYWFDELNKLYDKKIFLELNKDTFIKRKKLDLRWGKEPDWYIEHIWQSYLKYGRYKDSEKNILIVDANTEIDLQKIIDFTNYT